MRISTGWRRAILASCLPATVNLVLFQNVNKHDWKENILHSDVAALWSQVGINDIISPGSTKQFVRGRRGEGRADILGQVELSKDYYMRGATLPRLQACI